MKRFIILFAVVLCSCSHRAYINDVKQCETLPANQYFQCVEYFAKLKAEQDSAKVSRFNKPFPNF